MRIAVALLLVRFCSSSAEPVTQPQPEPEAAREPEPESERVHEPTPASPITLQPTLTDQGGACTAGAPHVLATLSEEVSPVRLAVGVDGGFVAWMSTQGQVSLQPVAADGSRSGERVQLAMPGGRSLLGIVRYGDLHLVATAAGAQVVLAQLVDADGRALGDAVRRDLGRPDLSRAQPSRTRLHPTHTGAVLVHDEYPMCDSAVLPLDIRDGRIVSGDVVRDGGTWVYKFCDDVIGHRVVSSGAGFGVIAFTRGPDASRAQLLVTRSRIGVLPTQGILRAVVLEDDTLHTLEEERRSYRRRSESLTYLDARRGHGLPMRTESVVDPSALSAPFDTYLRATLRMEREALELRREDALGRAVGTPVNLGSVVERYDAKLVWTGRAFLAAWPESTGSGTIVHTRVVECARRD